MFVAALRSLRLRLEDDVTVRFVGEEVVRFEESLEDVTHIVTFFVRKFDVENPFCVDGYDDDGYDDDI